MADTVQRAMKDVALLICEPVRLVEISGAEGEDLVHRLSTANLLTGKTGTMVPTAFLDQKGRLIDYVVVLKRESSLLVIVSEENENRLSDWVDRHTIMEDVSFRSVSDGMRIFSLLGPRAQEVVRTLLESVPEEGRFIEGDYEASQILVASRGDFGDERIDIIASSALVERLLNNLQARGVPILDSNQWELCRIIKGIPKSPNEVNGHFNPYEVNLGHALDFNKGCYVGQEVIARLDTYDKVQRKLVGVVSTEYLVKKELPSSLFESTGEEVGFLTSFSQDEIFGFHVGLAVVRKNQARTGTRLASDSGGPTFLVTDLPIPIELLQQGKLTNTSSSIGSSPDVK